MHVLGMVRLLTAQETWRRGTCPELSEGKLALCVEKETDFTPDSLGVTWPT